MKKILIIGCSNFGVSTMIESIKESEVNFVVNNIEAKNIVNSAFENEPIIIKNYHREQFNPAKIKDIHRNKYFDKPRNNFKK